MQKLLKIIGMISALIISVLGLSACSNNGVEMYGVVQPEYGVVPPEFKERVEIKETLDSGEATLGEIEDNDASSLE